ncbi:TRAP transporter small permease subunit [Thiotrichales bacterium HSG1]|nr:TRAP transporter small permease subunit [Thiotrichales bacterium HSG1]
MIVYQASMVSLFSIGSTALQELQWHLFAVIFLFGAAYTLKHDEHVRVDIIYNSLWLTDRHRAWIDLLGGLFFLIPFCLLIIIASWSFVYNSFIHLEISPDPGGLPYRFLLKAAIPLSFLLLMLQGIANILKKSLFLFKES